MRDYFAALASRVLQPERSVQPRPRVPFASPSVSAIDRGDSLASAEYLEVEPRSRRTAVSARAAVSDAGLADRGSSSSEPSADSAPRRPQRGSSRRQRSTRDEPAAEQHDPISFFVHPSVVAARTSRQTGAERGAIESAPSTPGGARTEKTGHPAVAPGPRRANDAAMRATSPVERTSADRVIRIHIGRVDVRAIQSSPAQTQPRPQDQRRAPMTLEEYVRQRGGGRS